MSKQEEIVNEESRYSSDAEVAALSDEEVSEQLAVASQSSKEPTPVEDSAEKEVTGEAKEKEVVEDNADNSEAQDSEGQDLESDKEAPQADLEGDKEEKVKAIDPELLLKRVQDKESFIGKQSEEIGLMRERIKAFEEAERQRLLDTNEKPVPEIKTEFDFDNPRESIAKMMQEAKSDGYSQEQVNAMVQQAVVNYESEKRQQELSILEMDNKVKEEVLNKVPNVETMWDEIGNLAIQDGFTEDQVSNFKANPWADGPNTILNYARRVELNRQLNEYKSKLENKVDSISRNSLNSSKTITKTSGNTPPSTLSLESLDVTQLSDEEVNELLKQHTG